jgi:hypothetical protein
MLLSSLGVLAQESNNTYKIISTSTFDSLDYDITIIKGNIMTVADNPIGWISFQKHDDIGKDYKTAYVNEDGSFIMRMPSIKGVLYATTLLGTEIILPMKEYKDKSLYQINFYSNDSLVPDTPPTVIKVDPIRQPSKKPVIYLYNDEKIDASLTLKYKGDLTFTYPKYDKGWTVSVGQNGIESNGRTYPYLFWEGEMEGLKFSRNNQNKIPSRIVKKKDVISFLEAELKGMGLNQKEMTDFITFWGPGMEQNDEVAVQFFRDQEYADKIATLDISPVPTTSIRIYMLYTPVTTDNRTQFQEIRTQYQPFVRTGFTIIEWGGTEIENIELMDEVKVRRKKRGEQTCGLVQSSTMEINRREH